jgi:hypothetical protein
MCLGLKRALKKSRVDPPGNKTVGKAGCGFEQGCKAGSAQRRVARATVCQRGLIATVRLLGRAAPSSLATGARG